jgi:hypothetical protein
MRPKMPPDEGLGPVPKRVPTVQGRAEKYRGAIASVRPANARAKCLGVILGPVMPGLDPGIHLKNRFIQTDGLPGQAPAMTADG